MKLYDQLVNKEEKLSLVGLGYVGMPIAVAFARKINVMMARAVAMTNLMSAVIYLFNTYVSLGIVWFGGRMSARMKENNARNGNATIIVSYK